MVTNIYIYIYIIHTHTHTYTEIRQENRILNKTSFYMNEWEKSIDTGIVPLMLKRILLLYHGIHKKHTQEALHWHL